MATWKDGAAYAPIERPDGFASPETDPLPQAAHHTVATPGPIPPPLDYAPMPRQPELAAIGGDAPPARSARAPFEVHSALMAAAPSKPGVRDPRAPFTITSSSVSSPQQPTMASSPWAPPCVTAMPPPIAAERLPDSPVELTQAQRTLMLVGGAAFFLGALFPVASPMLFAVGGGLLLRTHHVGRQVGIGALVVAVLSGIAIVAGAQGLVLDLNRWLGLLFGAAVLVTGASRRA